MTPHSGVGGWIPTPKKLNPAVFRTAQEIFVVDCVMSGDRELGSRWRNTRRTCALPMACAATAYSLTRSTNISPRTRRAYIGINRILKAIVRVIRVGRKTATKTRARTEERRVG